MKKSTLLALGFIVGIAMLYAVFQSFSFADLMSIIANVDAKLLLAYFGVSFLIFCLLAYRWTIVAKAHDETLTIKKSLGYRYVGFAVSFITPGPRVGGEPVRAALMKREGVSFPKALSTVIADKTIELTSFGVMLVIAVTIALVTVPLPVPLRMFFGGIALVVFLLIAYGFTQMLRGKDPVLQLFKLFRLHKIKALRKYEKELKEFESNIVAFYTHNARAFWGAQIISAIAWSLSLVEFKIILSMIGIDASFFHVLLVYTVVGVAYLIPIPLALGVLDAGQATLFAALSFGAAGGAFLAMMTRARDLLWTLVGFVLLTYYGFDSVKER